MIRVKVTRGVWNGGEAHAPGEVLHLSPLDAGELLASGRGVLVDQADLEAIYAAVREDVAKKVSAPIVSRSPSWMNTWGRSR